jgi:hypothetical protein
MRPRGAVTIGGVAAGTVVVVVDVVVDAVDVVVDGTADEEVVEGASLPEPELHAAHTSSSTAHAPLRPRPRRTPS